MTRRVVVTGIGIVSPLGNKEQLWTNLLKGISGIDNITKFDTSEFPVKIGAEVRDFNANDYIDKKDARRMDRFCHYAVAAAKQGLLDSNLEITEENASRIGVIVGSGIGGIETIEAQAKTLHERGISRVSPFLVPMLIPDMASGQIAINTGAKGPNSCTVTACATGTHSIGDAYRIIERGNADVMLAGGAEAAITPLGMAGFVSSRALSTMNDEPTKASRPFDKTRDGFIMAEGAGVLVIEELEHAQRRKAPIYGELIGYGSTADAYHITSPAPEGEGAQRAMREAISDAKIEFDDIGYINAHGTSTQYNDRLETKAIKHVFKEKAYHIPVSSTKSLTGHLLGAAGAIESVICLLALKNQVIPGTYNYEELDPDCDLDYVPNQPRELSFNIAMSNSFGFGGHNGVLVIKRWDE